MYSEITSTADGNENNNMTAAQAAEARDTAIYEMERAQTAATTARENHDTEYAKIEGLRDDANDATRYAEAARENVERLESELETARENADVEIGIANGLSDAADNARTYFEDRQQDVTDAEIALNEATGIANGLVSDANDQNEAAEIANAEAYALLGVANAARDAAELAIEKRDEQQAEVARLINEANLDGEGGLREQHAEMEQTVAGLQAAAAAALDDVNNFSYQSLADAVAAALRQKHEKNYPLC
jgi:hypothetical protein